MGIQKDPQSPGALEPEPRILMSMTISISRINKLFVYVYGALSIHIYIYIHMYVYIYTICIYIYICTDLFVLIFIFRFIEVCVCIYIYMNSVLSRVLLILDVALGGPNSVRSSGPSEDVEVDAETRRELGSQCASLTRPGRLMRSFQKEA